MGKRFLAVDMLAMVHGRHRCRGMSMIWSRNRNSIDLSGHFREHFSKIAEALRVWMTLASGRQVIRINIAQGDYVNLAMGTKRT
jgi:hypothetical protein